MNEEFIFVLFFAVLLVIFFIPSIVAFLRGHHYKWIILALNIFGGALLASVGLLRLYGRCGQVKRVLRIL